MLLPVADDDSGWVRGGRLRSFEEVVGLEDTASGGSRLRTIAEELLDRQGLGWSDSPIHSMPPRGIWPATPRTPTTTAANPVGRTVSERRLTVTAVTSAVLVAVTASAAGLTSSRLPSHPSSGRFVSMGRLRSRDRSVRTRHPRYPRRRESDDIEVGIGREYTYPGYHDAAGSNRTMGNKDLDG